MIIIVEGPNGVGKTTLCETLKDRYGLEYMKEEKPNEPGFPYYLKKALSYKHDIVFDRYLLGEYVYPKLFNDGRKPLENWEQRAIERVLQVKNTFLIYANVDKPTKLKIFEERGEDLVDASMVDDESDYFDEAYRKSILPKITYNFKKDDLEDVYKQIDKIDNQSISLATGNRFMPKVMFIGDVINTQNKFFRLNPSVEKRAFSVDNASSKFFHQAIEHLDDVYITNTNKNLNSEIVSVRPQVIISLGKNAGMFCDRLEINHQNIFHPQYYSRFKGHDIGAYREVIDEAIKNYT